MSSSPLHPSRATSSTASSEPQNTGRAASGVTAPAAVPLDTTDLPRRDGILHETRGASTGPLQQPRETDIVASVSGISRAMNAMLPLAGYPQDAEVGETVNGLLLINSPSGLADWEGTADLACNSSSSSQTVAGQWAREIAEALVNPDLSAEQITQLGISGAVLGNAVAAAAFDESSPFDEDGPEKVVVARGTNDETLAVVRYRIDKKDPHAIKVMRLGAAPRIVIGRLTGANSRTKGGGTACLGHVARETIRTGRERITVDAAADAVPFYQKIGFTFRDEQLRHQWEDSLGPGAERLRSIPLQVNAHDLLRIAQSRRT